MDTVNISCDIACNGAGLHLRAAVGDCVLFDGDPNGQIKCSTSIPDADGEHELIFTLSKKTAEHTRVDADGNIVDDVVVTITDISFDEISLGYTLLENSSYTHDFNGTGEPVTEKFSGTMGCNGTVTLKFSTPVYLWLLEHM